MVSKPDAPIMGCSAAICLQFTCHNIVQIAHTCGNVATQRVTPGRQRSFSMRALVHQLQHAIDTAKMYPKFRESANRFMFHLQVKLTE